MTESKEAGSVDMQEVEDTTQDLQLLQRQHETLKSDHAALVDALSLLPSSLKPTEPEAMREFLQLTLVVQINISDPQSIQIVHPTNAIDASLSTLSPLPLPGRPTLKRLSFS